MQLTASGSDEATPAVSRCLR